MADALKIQFRQIRPGEADAVTYIEQTCFPAHEACKPEIMEKRVEIFPETILLAELVEQERSDACEESMPGKDVSSKEIHLKEEKSMDVQSKEIPSVIVQSKAGTSESSPCHKSFNRIIGFVIGLATDESSLRDEFFTEPELHKADGDNIMILSVAVLPDYQRKGIAREMMKAYLEIEKSRGRKTSVLTCLEEKVTMYASWGYEDLGASKSNWGGESWHEMIVRL